MNGLKIQTDDPITKEEQDSFNRITLVNLIVKAILNNPTENSIVIGIHGKWGSGKTSVINLIEKGLQECDNTPICIHFNPWIFDDVTSLVKFFFNTIADKLDSSLSTRTEKIGTLLRDYSSIISPVLGQVPIISLIGNEETIKKIGNNLSNVKLADLKKRIDTILAEESRKVVVFIDDIDRLDKKEVHLIFKLVKLCANFNNITYVLAFDREMVAKSIKDSYGNGDKQDGYEFIEKIVQFPIELPKINEIDLNIFFADKVGTILEDHNILLSDIERQRFWITFTEVIKSNLKTPRQVTLYCNSLTFSLSALKNEINIVDLLLIEGIKILYPDQFQVIRDNPTYFILSGDFFSTSDQSQSLEKCKELIDQSLEKSKDIEITSVKALIKEIFPRTKGIDGNISYPPEWERSWYKEKRLASEEYFDKYFGLSVQRGKLSDNLFERIVQKISQIDSPEEAQIIIQKVCNKGYGKSFLEKIDHIQGSRSPDQLEKIIKGLAISGNEFKQNIQTFGLSDFEDAALKLAKMVELLPTEEERFHMSKWIIFNGQPLHFTVQFYRWIKASSGQESNKSSSESILTSENITDIKQQLSYRIKEISEESGIPIFTEFPEDYQYMLYYWADGLGREETDRYLKKCFADDPKSTIQFLEGYRTTQTDLSCGIRKPGGLYPDSVKGISKIVDLSAIQDALDNVFGEEISNELISGSEQNEQLLLAQQFMKQSIKLQKDGDEIVHN